MHVRSGDPLLVAPTDSVAEVLRQMKQSSDGGAVVCENGKLAGIFTERDALKVIAEEHDLTAPVSDHMSTKPASVNSKQSIGMAIRSMSTGGYRRLPIVDDSGSVVGILKVSHILRYLVEHFPEFVYNLAPSPDHATQEREGA